MLSGKKALAMLVFLVLLGVAAFGCAQAGGDGGKGAAQDTKIRTGVFNWAENIAAVNLWKHVLEEKGYEVQAGEWRKGGYLFRQKNEAKRILALQTKVINQDGKTVVEGAAKVMKMKPGPED